MNPGVYSVKHSRIVFALTFIFIVGGIFAYRNLGRLEDPEFTIKQALIITPYLGASPEEVAREVTNPIESAVQQMGRKADRMPAPASSEPPAHELDVVVPGGEQPLVKRLLYGPDRRGDHAADGASERA